MNGAKPDPARAVEVADERGWFDGVESDQFGALNRLVAWIFSGGSINSNYVPAFTVDGRTEHRATDALETLGLDWRRDREHDPNRATEIVPTTHASVLGRALLVLGAPKGAKNERADISPRVSRRRW